MSMNPRYWIDIPCKNDQQGVVHPVLLTIYRVTSNIITFISQMIEMKGLG